MSGNNLPGAYVRRAQYNGRSGGGQGNNSNGQFQWEDEGLWSTASFWNNKVVYKLLKLFFLLVAFFCLMVLINVKLGPGYNLVFFFGTSFVYTAIVLGPIPVVASLLLGTFYAWLSNSRVSPRDLSQGALQGLRTLLDPILIGGIIGIQVVTGFLATWSFALNWSAAFYVLGAGILIALTFHRWKVGLGKWFAWGVTAYSVGVIIAALWSTLPVAYADWGSFFSKLPGVGTESTLSPEEARRQTVAQGFTGDIDWEVPLNTPLRIGLASFWREVNIPPGTCLEGDPIDQIKEQLPRQRGVATIQSLSGEKIYIYLTWKKSGTCRPVRS